MQLTNKELENLAHSLSLLYGGEKPTGFRLGNKANYAIRKNLPKIQTELKPFNDTLLELYKQSDAKFVDNGNGTLSVDIEDAEKKISVSKERDELHAIKVEIDLHKFDESELFIEENNFTPAFVESLSVLINES